MTLRKTAGNLETLQCFQVTKSAENDKFTCGKAHLSDFDGQ